MPLLDKIKEFFASSSAGAGNNVTPNNDAEGSSGTRWNGGTFAEEYLDALVSPPGHDVFDEMARGDYQIAMILDMIKNPLLGSEWPIVAASEDKKDVEIAEAMKFLIKDAMGLPKKGKLPAKPQRFETFLNEALTVTKHGFSLFEITHKLIVGHPEFGDLIGVKEIGFRSQRSIEQWILSDGEGFGVRMWSAQSSRLMT